MKGYLNRPEATAEAFAGGWFHTGDLGYMDEDGFFFIVDRKKELIIRGGYNVYPREVEEVLYAHPAVAEVAVIGIPDDRLGEEVRAVIALKSGRVVGRGGGDRLLQGAPRRLQVPALGGVPGRATEERDRQDPQEGAEGLISSEGARSGTGAAPRRAAAVGTQVWGRWARRSTNAASRAMDSMLRR